MKKLDSLRAFLVSYVPAFKANPSALGIYAKDGTIATRGTAALGFEYRFDAVIDVFDYADDPDTLFLPILIWLRDKEIALIQSYDTNDKAIRYQVDILDNKAYDISISFALSEAVDVNPRNDGTGYDLTHRDEPRQIGLEPLLGVGGVPVTPGTLLTSVYVDGQQIFSAPPPPPPEP